MTRVVRVSHGDDTAEVRCGDLFEVVLNGETIFSTDDFRMVEDSDAEMASWAAAVSDNSGSGATYAYTLPVGIVDELRCVEACGEAA